ncbi:IS110 family transposase [Streptomyces phaeochromogenes]|uniref:IS110 family transposase n=1 Tax=Streptomyces phaeochromogenes TaxID=1923 RepID=UPI0032471E04
MDVLVERVAGLDVSKGDVKVCVRGPLSQGSRRYRDEVRTFSTMTRSLLLLSDWLAEEGVELVVMEATADYWKPVFYLLEEQFEVWLVNARDIKRVPGRKTDVSDARWIAQVAQHGLVSPSFVPPPRIRRLRDLTRQRTSLVRERSRALNRLEKVLEDAGIKTSLVLTKTLSMSSRAMIEALIAGERDPVVLADLAIGKARSKMTDLREALTGRFEDHHAFLASQALAHIDAIDAQTAAFDQRIETETAPMRRQHNLLITIPGISTGLAQVVIAETGVDMTRFPTAAALASWSGVAPGNNQSAGRSYSGATTHGNVWLKGGLGDAAAAAARTKGTYLNAHYRRLIRRMGKKRALVAVMHKIVIAMWHMLTNDARYQDLGPNHWQQHPHQAKRRQQRLIAELSALGVDTSGLEPA